MVHGPAEMLLPFEPERCLKSSSRARLAVPKSRLKTKGDQAFTVRAPQLWNSLSSLEHFLLMLAHCYIPNMSYLYYYYFYCYYDRQSKIQSNLQ